MKIMYLRWHRQASILKCKSHATTLRQVVSILIKDWDIALHSRCPNSMVSYVYAGLNYLKIYHDSLVQKVHPTGKCRQGKAI